ncbi:hypothetical protein MUP77_24650 [Candidatus Bathyarchaeota archaeon]|nr:hypothetical protein [Candidatus Bathyarchaeota archaeon]
MRTIELRLRSESKETLEKATGYFVSKVSVLSFSKVNELEEGHIFTRFLTIDLDEDA